MNCTQNLKIEQVTDQTLVIGMDIAKQKHYAAIVDARGRVLKESFSVSQSRIGFEQFYALIQETMREFGKTEVIVGIEPTGHYWLNLAYFLEEKGIPLVMVNPMHVKRSKELDDNLPTKHDAKDALVIANSAWHCSQFCLWDSVLTQVEEIEEMFPRHSVLLRCKTLPLFRSSTCQSASTLDVFQTSE